MNTKSLCVFSRFVSFKDDQHLGSLFIFKMMNGNDYLVNRDVQRPQQKQQKKHHSPLSWVGI